MKRILLAASLRVSSIVYTQYTKGTAWIEARIVPFKRNTFENTDNYTFNITNLNTNSSFSSNVTTDKANIKITHGAPNSWFVISKATRTSATTSSRAFGFFNEDPVVENYVPFPAEAITPKQCENLSSSEDLITLNWSANDLDNDAATYEVLFGTNVDALNSIDTVEVSTLKNREVEANTIYYWQIKTVGEFQNSSTSDIFKFRINN